MELDSGMGLLNLHVPRTPAQAPPSCTDSQVTGDKERSQLRLSTQPSLPNDVSFGWPAKERA